VENFRFDPPIEQAHDPATVKFDFHNAGRTPALKATFKCDIVINDKKTTQKPTDFPSEMTIGSDRSAGTSVSIWIRGPGDFEGITQGTGKGSLQGVITYTDIFKDVHPTTFCAVYDSKVTKTWLYCPGNDVK
jgi:hypothetical protein